MEQITIQITETIKKVVKVDCIDSAEAIANARNKYDLGQIDMRKDNTITVEITPVIIPKKDKAKYSEYQKEYVVDQHIYLLLPFSSSIKDFIIKEVRYNELVLIDSTNGRKSITLNKTLIQQYSKKAEKLHQEEIEHTQEKESKYSMIDD